MSVFTPLRRRARRCFSSVGGIKEKEKKEGEEKERLIRACAARAVRPDLCLRSAAQHEARCHGDTQSVATVMNNTLACNACHTCQNDSHSPLSGAQDTYMEYSTQYRCGSCRNQTVSQLLSSVACRINKLMVMPSCTEPVRNPRNLFLQVVCKSRLELSLQMLAAGTKT